MSRAGILFGVTLILFVYGGANYYIGKKLFNWLKLLFPDLNGPIFALLYTFFVLSLIAMILPLPSSLKSGINWIGSYWMGIFVYLLLFYLLTDCIILLGSALKIIPHPIPQSIHYASGLTVILLTIGFVSYGIYNAHQIQHVSYKIQTNKVADLKIVLVSDLHLGAVNSEKRLAKIVDQINKLEPDLVAIAGDIFNDDYHAIQDPEKAMQTLKKIQSKYGVYSCLGNHDGGKTFDQMIHFLKQSNIQLLNDEYVIIDQKLVLFGRVDPSPIGGFGKLHRKDIADQLASLYTNLPIVVMDHNPGNLNQYGKKIDLVLSGHTHKGQIFPFNFITNAVFDVDYGYYKKNDTSPHVIVTSGVGTWGMPMRVGTNSEIVSIYLQ